MLALLSLMAALTAGQAPQAEIGRARFVQPSLGLSKVSTSSRTVVIGGAVRVSFCDFAKPSVRCPVLHITCLCSQNGALTCYHGFWNELRTYAKIRSSDVSQALKATGVKLTGEERKKALSDPQLISSHLPEVLRERYALTCLYGNPLEKGRGFFRLSNPTGADKLLLVRLEMWQNGVKIGEHESSQTGLGKFDLPKDWYVWKKYPQKFRYVDAP